MTKTVWAKSLDRLWAEDRNLLRRVGSPVLDQEGTTYEDWGQRQKGLNEACVSALQKAKGKGLEERVVEARARSVGKKVEAFCGVKFLEFPSVHVVPAGEYEGICGEQERDFCKRLGMKEERLGQIPPIWHMHGCDQLLIPDMSLVHYKQTGVMGLLNKVGGDVGGICGKENYKFFPYPVGELDRLLVMGLVASLISQSCGEWKDGYFETYRKRGDEYLVHSGRKNIMMQFVCGESLCETPYGASCLIAGKILEVWSDAESRVLYQGVKAMMDAEGVLATMQSDEFFRPTGDVRKGYEKLQVIPYEEFEAGRSGD